MNKEMANALRALSMDMVERAQSGHPGMPLGMADIATVLWTQHLRHDPARPNWINRDRFILSNGHGSALLYSLLHLSGYDMPLAELKNFRAWQSTTPGHPEYGLTAGVDSTTGPLGQGLANGVGMALCEQLMSKRFNRSACTLFDHHSYVFVGDGCLMEGISHEACSLAGVLGLGKLIVFYDDNGISIDGKVKGWFNDDSVMRFEAYGWHVIADVDGHDLEQINQAIISAKNSNRPSLICCKTIIGKGSPNKANSAGVHGSPLGSEEIAATRIALDHPYDPFEIPESLYQEWNARDAGARLSTAWDKTLGEYGQKYADLYQELMRRCDGVIDKDLIKVMDDWIVDCQKTNKPQATRASSKACLDHFAPMLPELIGGSADLSGSNSTLWTGSVVINNDAKQGNYLHYGVREFAMSAIANGMALYGAFIPYVGTFLVFSDYARNAVRLAALMELRTIFVYSHDSIGVGEDGPTHQPIEQLPSLRLIPNLNVWRPADLVETAVAWRSAITTANTPTALLLSRQKTSLSDIKTQQLSSVAKGGYILLESSKTPVAIIISSGSEIGACLEAARSLHKEGKAVRVVSMPCVEVFEQQSVDYKELVLPATVQRRLVVEAAHSGCWYKYIGDAGAIISIDCFGDSAPADVLMQHYGFDAENIINKMRVLLKD